MRQKVMLGLAVAGLSAAVASAQVGAGGEFRVNTYVTGSQIRPSAAADPRGNLMVVWLDTVETGETAKILGQHFDASGARLGAEFQIGTETSSLERPPSLAADGAGGFVVTWAVADEGGSYLGIRARRFGASGAPLGSEIQVSNAPGGLAPSVAADAAGNFVVVWPAAGGGILARRFDASGAPREDAFPVSTYTSAPLDSPAVASDPTGGFVVAWSSISQQDSVFAQRFDASGQKQGAEFRVNELNGRWHGLPALAGDATGAFVIAWTERSHYAWRVLVRRYDALGEPRGAEFEVPGLEYLAMNPSVASDAAGDFAVVWEPSVFGQRYDSAGVPRGDKFPFGSIEMQDPVLASDPVGNLLVVWSADDGGFGNDVYGERFGGLVPAALRVDAYPSGYSDGNDVLEQNEAVGVWTWWRNVNGQPQTFDGQGLSFTGPATDAVYALGDASGAYGTVANGATAACSDCYAVGVSSGARPATHWDATFTERLTPDVHHGQTKLWAMHIGDSFADVPRSSPYYRSVETLLHKGVTGGCAANSYCPGSAVTREQLAVFVLAGKEGASYRPQACATPVFGDVPASSPFCRYVEDLARRGVVGGCGGGNYCPASPVTREQMPVVVLRTLEPTLEPPACEAPMFADVPLSSPFCRWIHELARRGVVNGCGGGNYCPSDAVSREQMAVFISATFGLTLYGP